jgi:hypothetical protein
MQSPPHQKIKVIVQFLLLSKKTVEVSNFRTEQISIICTDSSCCCRHFNSYILALILGPTTTPNVAKAYNCNSNTMQANSHSNTHATSSVSGASGSCAITASSSSNTQSVGGGHQGGSPPNQSGFIILRHPGASISSGVGGTQSSCIAQSANLNKVGNTNSDSQQGSCNAHSP